MSAEDGVCERHGRRLESGPIPVRYGMIRFSPEHAAARARDFPNANSFELGGCVIEPDSEHVREGRFCPKCRSAEKRWKWLHFWKH